MIAYYSGIAYNRQSCLPVITYFITAGVFFAIPWHRRVLKRPLYLLKRTASIPSASLISLSLLRASSLVSNLPIRTL